MCKTHTLKSSPLIFFVRFAQKVKIRQTFAEGIEQKKEEACDGKKKSLEQNQKDQ